MHNGNKNSANKIALLNVKLYWQVLEDYIGLLELLSHQKYKFFFNLGDSWEWRGKYWSLNG